MLRFFYLPLITIFFSAILLTSFGLATLYTPASENLIFHKQLLIILISIFAGLGISFLPLRPLRQGNLIFYTYISSLMLLIIILALGITVNNAQSWFRIGGVSIQPSEIAKLSIIFVLAKYLYQRHVDIANVRHVLMSFLYVLLVGLLVLKQPDLGSALVIFGIWGVVLFVSGVSKKHLFGIIILAGLVFYGAWHFVFKDYQKERILNFIDPLRDVRGSGYNVYQAIIAVGSGGMYGKGIAQGTQSTLKYLPESDTDFIFASFAEEWGLVGTILCIITFLLLIISLLYIAPQLETNFETLVVVGIASYFLIHFVVNVGMNVGVLPVTGIPLPFMSAGGTHTLLEWTMLGIALSMYYQISTSKRTFRRKELFSIS